MFDPRKDGEGSRSARTPHVDLSARMDSLKQSVTPTQRVHLGSEQPTDTDGKKEANTPESRTKFNKCCTFSPLCSKLTNTLL